MHNDPRAAVQDPHSCRTHTQAGDAIVPGGAWDPALHHIGCFDLLVFGPFFVIFIFAMIYRQSWIRAPTLFMVGLQFGMIVEYLIADFAGDLPPPDTLRFLGCLAPEAGFWLLCAWRPVRPPAFALLRARERGACVSEMLAYK